LVGCILPPVGNFLEQHGFLCSSARMKMPSSSPATFCRRPAAGLTLVEILVTLAIVALLMTLAVPSFKPLLDRWRVRQAEGAVTDTIRLARTEAIKRGGNVVMEKMANSTDNCTTAPLASDWGCGWRLFVDSDGNGKYTQGEEVLLHARVPGGMGVTHVLAAAGTSAETIAINRWGNMDGIHAKSFIIYPYAEGTGSTAARRLCVSAGGRILEKVGATC
jgi:type IV fimbrial biogenesis protein FimT